MARVTKEYNLEVINPNLAKQWHPTNNGSLSPRDAAPYTHKRIWWKCDKDHEWEATVDNRNGKGSAYPYCARRRE